MMRRLHLQVYVAFIGILILIAVLVGVAVFVAHDHENDRRWLAGLGEVLGKVLPDPDRPIVELEAALTTLRGQFDLDLAVQAADGAPLAAVGAPLPAISPLRAESGRLRGQGLALALRLPDGRWLAARHVHRHFGLRWILVLALLALALAAATYPVARRITGRLERLQSRVDDLGAGDLTARVDVEGKDEVAALARSFNRAAEWIQHLVDAQRSMLAGASHELRSPLTRIRMGLELLTGQDRPELRDRMSHDIAELDELIDEILLASRLQTMDASEPTENIDLLALVAEEGARVDAHVGGVPVRVTASARLLRRMARNLFENARRHGRGTPIEATVEAGEGGGARITVEDAGPGVPEGERDRIFEPFYRPAGAREGEDRGVGMGLALVRQIARRHGGDVRYLAREGGGSRFEVTLDDT